MGSRELKKNVERARRRAYYESLSPEEKKEYRARIIREKKLKKLKRMAFGSAALLVLMLVGFIGVLAGRGESEEVYNPDQGVQAEGGETQAAPASAPADAVPDWVVENLIRVNRYSRPGTPLEQVNGIVIHYTGNPGTTAEQNRSYFDGLADTGETSASSHFVIGIDGTVIQCVPLDEIAYASNERNADTISIECCHSDETGKFSEETYDSLVRLVKWLEEAYNLEPEDVIRHYDVTGKECPLYYVENPEAWEQFLKDIAL